MMDDLMLDICGRVIVVENRESCYRFVTFDQPEVSGVGTLLYRNMVRGVKINRVFSVVVTPTEGYRFVLSALTENNVITVETYPYTEVAVVSVTNTIVRIVSWIITEKISIVVTVLQ